MLAKNHIISEPYFMEKVGFFFVSDAPSGDVSLLQYTIVY